MQKQKLIIKSLIILFILTQSNSCFSQTYNWYVNGHLIQLETENFITPDENLMLSQGFIVGDNELCRQIVLSDGTKRKPYCRTLTIEDKAKSLKSLNASGFITITFTADLACSGPDCTNLTMVGTYEDSCDNLVTVNEIISCVNGTQNIYSVDVAYTNTPCELLDLDAVLSVTISGACDFNDTLLFTKTITASDLPAGC